MTDPQNQFTRKITLSKKAQDYMRSMGVNPNTIPKLHSSLIQVDKLFKVYLVDARSVKYPVNKDQFMIGGEEDNDCVISNDTVSRRHAVIQRDGSGNFWLRDMGSTNGTFLNGKKLTEPVVLNHGDQITLADQRFTFYRDK